MPFEAVSSSMGKRRRRTVISCIELTILEQIFNVNPRPSRNVKEQLARDLGKTEEFVNIWFQNRRARFKKQLKNTNAEDIPNPTKQSDKCGREVKIPSSASEESLLQEDSEAKMILKQNETISLSLHHSESEYSCSTRVLKNKCNSVSNEKTVELTKLNTKDNVISSSISTDKFQLVSSEGPGTDQCNLEIMKKELKRPLTIPVENLMLFHVLVAIASKTEMPSKLTDLAALNIDENMVVLASSKKITYSNDTGFQI